MPNVSMFDDAGEAIYTEHDGEPITEMPPEAPSVSQDATELSKTVGWSRPAGMTIRDLWAFMDEHFADRATGEISDTITPLVIEISIGGVKVEQPLVCVQIADGKVRLVAKAAAGAT